jgi:hypothetical protein
MSFEATIIGSLRYGFAFVRSDFAGSKEETRRNYQDLRCAGCNCKNCEYIIQVLGDTHDNVVAIDGLCFDCREEYGVKMAPVQVSLSPDEKLRRLAGE